MNNTISQLTLSVLLLVSSFTISITANAAGGSNALTQEQQAAITPTKALSMLKRGNQRFLKGEMTNTDYVAQVKQTSTGQFPFASIVSCLDSRIPPALVFDRGIGDLFVARVAGNFVNDDILGSLEFAAKLAGSKIIVVMGHTDCGAVKGACDGAQLGLLTTTLANINPAVQAQAGNYSPANSSNDKFVDAVAEENVRLNMKKLRDRSVVLREMIDKGEISLVGAMYDIDTGKVRFL
jgi:carbonic anhydrase